MARVIMKLDPKDGTRTFEVEGVMGGACEDITRALMQSNEVQELEYTSEHCVPEELPDYINQGE